MKTHTKRTLLAGAAALTTAILNTNAATTVINFNNDGRALDTHGTGTAGEGNSINNDVAQVGHYANGHDLSGVFVFQMTNAINPADITSADFSVTQSPSGTIDFDASAHVIGIRTTSTILASDFQTSDLTLMAANFDNDNANGSVSLDAGGQTSLATYLSTNWSVDDYLFIGLKTDLDSPNTGGTTAVLNYSDSALNITTVPEPSSTALLGLGGLALILRRRK